MNTSAVVATTKRILSRIGAACRRFPSQLFGNVSYRAPGWLSSFLRRWGQFEQKHSRLIGLSIIGLFLIACAAAWTWNWYQHLPKPRRVTVKVQPIQVTKLEKD